MSELRHRITEHCERIAPPCPADLGDLSPEHIEVLRQANGFSTKHGFFRFFGTAPALGLPSVSEWNQAPWKSKYGALLADVLIFAEDIFGDQYGFKLHAEQPELCKIYCEGGIREALPVRSLREFLECGVLVPQPTAFDFVLATQAFEAGIRPKLHEHLAFALPLIVGGEPSIANLGVEPGTFHLELLGQLTTKNATIPDGTPIRRFVI